MKIFTFEDNIPVGKYKDKTFGEIFEKDKNYFKWFISSVFRLPGYGTDFMYHEDLKKARFNIKDDTYSYTSSKSEFATCWSEDVFGGYDSMEMC